MTAEVESKHWQILLVEDDEEDFLITKELLAEAKGGQFKLDWVQFYEQALRACQAKPYDVYLIDYRLKERDGLELAREFMAKGCRAPMILLTGYGSYQLDVEAMKSGVTDFLVKGEVNAPLLERTIRYALERKAAEEALRQAQEELEMRVQARTRELTLANQELLAEISERQRAQEALERSEARFRKLAETTSTAIFIIQDGQIRYANPAARMISGYEAEELHGRNFWELAHPAYQGVLKEYGVANQWVGELAEQIPARYELKLTRKGGEERWADVSAGGIEYEGDPALVVTVFDITERDLAEQALRQAKRELEARVAARTVELREANEQLALANERLAEANHRLEFELGEHKRTVAEKDRLLAQVEQHQQQAEELVQSLRQANEKRDSKR